MDKFYENVLKVSKCSSAIMYYVCIFEGHMNTESTVVRLCICIHVIYIDILENIWICTQGEQVYAYAYAYMYVWMHVCVNIWK